MSETERQCARCGSSVAWVECENCDDGYTGHDCGDDSCCCRYPEDNVVCDRCLGRAGWYVCCSDAAWCEAHPAPGRQNTPRSDAHGDHAQPGRQYP